MWQCCVDRCGLFRSLSSCGGGVRDDIFAKTSHKPIAATSEKRNLSKGAFETKQIDSTLAPKKTLGDASIGQERRKGGWLRENTRGVLSTLVHREGSPGTSDKKGANGAATIPPDSSHGQVIVEVQVDSRNVEVSGQSQRLKLIALVKNAVLF